MAWRDLQALAVAEVLTGTRAEADPGELSGLAWASDEEIDRIIASSSETS